MHCDIIINIFSRGGRRGRDRMVVGFITTYEISAPLRRRVLDTTLCDKVCR